MRTSSVTAALLAAALLAACSPEFGLQELPPAEEAADDTAAPAEDAQDEAPPAEEEPQEDEPADEPVDEEQPAEEEEPAPEEEEPAPEEEEEPAPEDDCEHTSDLVYVVDRDRGAIHLFDPEALSFTELGRVSCTGGASPESMAVGRDGVAWVRGSDDRLYSVDLATFACSRAATSLPSGFGSFGMGFATEDAGTWRDELYLADADSLGVLDTETGAFEMLGGMASQSELTGNADGELWAFLPLESPAALVEVDKRTGRELDRIGLSAFPHPSDIDTFAFATWGGDFWLFVRSYGMGNSTDVYQVGTDGTMRRVMVDVGFDVVGAGVSTCAPAE